jgi:hypothetical protein
VAYVVEHNYTGQLARLIRETLPSKAGKLRSVVRYDGFPFRSSDLVAQIKGA